MRGAPGRSIQELAGHRELTMTQRYMHLSPTALGDAIRLLDESAPVLPGHGDIVETVSRVFSLLLAGTIAFHLTSRWSM
jgi:hypothetical protein